MNIETILKYSLIIIATYMAIVTLLSILIFKYPGITSGLKKILARLSGFEFVGNEQVVFQDSYTNCGAACVEMILKLQAIPYDEEDLRDLKLMQGTTMLDLYQMSLQFKLQGGGFNFEKDDIFLEKVRDSNIATIVLLNWSYFYSKNNLLFLPIYYFLKLVLRDYLSQLNHWVVVRTADNNKNLFILDPYLGKLKLDYQRFEHLWNRNALLLYKPT